MRNGLDAEDETINPNERDEEEWTHSASFGEYSVK